VTQEEDRPLKYPTIFNTADVAVITKLDLAVAVEFDAAARANRKPSTRACLGQSKSHFAQQELR
jgi:Ni2+-binding GTPase involved in maturation of urease and hydrogenase